MKQTLLFLSICSFFTLSAQEVEENFDAYTAGDYVGEVSLDLEPWSGTAGGADDVALTDTLSYSEPNSMELFSTNLAQGGPGDMFMPLGYDSNGYDVDFYMYVAPDAGGYFNIQTTTTPGDGWAYDVFFYPDGTVELSLNQVAQPVTGTYTNGAWALVNNHIDLVNDIATVSIDGVEAFSTPFPSGLGGVNFYALGTANAGGHYFIDDIVVTGFIPQNVSEENLNPNIYPIPAQDQLNIAAVAIGSNYSVLDVLGKEITFGTTSELTTKIDVSTWETGIYFVKIKSGQGEVTRRIVVE